MTPGVATGVRLGGVEEHVLVVAVELQERVQQRTHIDAGAVILADRPQHDADTERRALRVGPAHPFRRCGTGR